MSAVLNAVDKGCRTIATVILLNAAGIPFSLAFIPFWAREDPSFPLTAAAFLVLAALFVPWLGFIFPRILRFCWRREQVWPASRRMEEVTAPSAGGT